MLRLLRGEPLDALNRELRVEVYRLEQRREKAILGIDEALRDQTGVPLQTDLDAAKRHSGELSMEKELLRRERDLRRPFARQEVVEMSREASPMAGKADGVQRVCPTSSISFAAGRREGPPMDRFRHDT